MVKKYHKIDSVYKRGDRGRFTDKFARPEFEYLFNNTWIGTEKIHGVNMRMGLKHDGHLVKDIRGRTDEAQIPPHLLTKMNDLQLNLLKPTTKDFPLRKPLVVV